MDSSKDADLNPEPEPVSTKKKKSNDSGSEDVVEDDLRSTPGDRLSEDELTLIFCNSWISTQDLFNLRLVSKSWRDAATTTLRRRDACVVELFRNSNEVPPCFYKSSGKNTDENQLSQLTDLISSSQKFPATDFRIRISLDTFTRYTEFPDLLHFFKLHGNKIKTIRPYGWISHKCLLDILFNYAPILEHLHLSEARSMSLNEGADDEGQTLDFERTSKPLPIKSLTLREFELCTCLPPPVIYNEDNDLDNDMEGNQNCQHNHNAPDRQLLHLLLSSPSKLDSIENVTLKTLGIILREGKGHLIRSFKCKPHDMCPSFEVILIKFVSLNPKLSKVTFDFGFSDPLPAFVTLMNEFIQSFKDTVQNLTLSFRYNEVMWDPLLKLPPMKKLKSFSLIGMSKYIHVRIHCETKCQQKVEHFYNFRGTVFQFESGILAQSYFPSLMEVSVASRHGGFKEASLMSFFAFKLNSGGSSSNSTWDSLPKVDILRIGRVGIESRPKICRSRTSSKAPKFSKVFPNIRILKFKCGEVGELSNDLWALCPNVEFMEIYGIENCSSDGGDVEKSHFVDKVFTGLSYRMLQNLRRSGECFSREVDNSEESKSTCRRPCICDLSRLRELKLKFLGKWSTQFASSATGLHALSKMPNTKFIISYDPEMSTFALKRDLTQVSYSDDDDDGVNREDSYDGNEDIDTQFSNEKDESDGTTDNESGGGNDDGRNEIVGNIDEGNDSEESDDHEIAKYEELIFGPIKPYVYIVHEKQIDLSD